MLGGLDTAFDAFDLLVHRWVWILPGVAHQNGAHVAQFADHETLRDAMAARTIGVGAVLGETQDAVFGENWIETAQVMPMLAQIGHWNSCL